MLSRFIDQLDEFVHGNRFENYLSVEVLVEHIKHFVNGEEIES
jgi:hypothetical protein